MSRNLEYGRVYTTRIQKPHFSGLGVYDPEKVFFREDPNGKVYVDDKLVKIVKTKDESNLVMIGDKLYKFVTIGDQIWLAENLDLPFANASYYNNDPAQSEGLLYRGQDMGDLNDYLLENNVGWHVPTMAEFESLVATAGGSSVAGSELKSTTSWNTNNGTDSLGFDGKAGGIYVGGTYSYKGSYGVFWTCVPGGSSKQNRFALQDATAEVYINGLADSCGVNVRLIKDTDPVEVGGKIYHTAKIGSQIWTIENLDWIAPGMAYNVTTIPDTPSVWYYNYADEEPKEHAGALYNAYAAKYINDNNLIPGWHVPCYGDVQELISNIGGTTGAGVKLRNLTGWVSESSAATNNYRFNAIPAGNRSTVPAFGNLGSYALFYTDTIDDTDAYRLNINDSKDVAFGKILAKNGLSIRLVKDTDPVTIGDKTYKTCQIGKQLWMAQNLDYIFEGLNVGGAVLQSDVHAWYFRNDPSQSEGLLYNGYAASYLAEHPELLPEGWRIPTQDDLVYLQNFVTTNDGGKKLKATGTYGGVNWGGIDACRFDGKPAGIIRSNGVFDNRYNYLRFWSRYLPSDTKQTFANMQSDTDTLTITCFDNNRSTAISIRLVKDISTEDLSLSKGPLSKGPLSTVVEDGKENIDETTENKR